MTAIDEGNGGPAMEVRLCGGYIWVLAMEVQSRKFCGGLNSEEKRAKRWENVWEMRMRDNVWEKIKVKNNNKKMNKNEYLNKNGCIIDSLMWVFCKNDHVK